MESEVKYFQFFRFGSAIGFVPTLQGCLWLVDSLKYLEFDYQIFLEDISKVGIFIHTFTYQDFLNMPYGDLVKAFPMWQRLIKKVQNG